MVSLAVAVLTVAALCWPASTSRGRLSRLHGWTMPPTAKPVGWGWVSGRGGERFWIEQRWVRWASRLLVGLAAGCGVLLAGPGGGLAAAMVCGTARHRWRDRRDRQMRASVATGLSDALGVLVAELRAGAHPSDAATAAATDGHVDASRALSAAAAAARLGGDVPAVLRGSGPAQLHPWLGRLADAWVLAERHGIPLADLVDAVRVDTEQRVRFAAEVEARLAGPRASAAVLAGLPVLGLGLGHAVGADPLQILGSSGPGQALLVIGAGLACAGVLWSARLVARAVPS